MARTRNYIAIFLSLVIAVAVGIYIGWMVRAHGWRSVTQVPLQKKSSSTECHLVTYLGFRVRPDSEPLWAEWELCPDSSRVRIEKSPRSDDVIKTFENDLVQRMQLVELGREGEQQLLVVTESAGTGVYIDWCVFGLANGALRCWEKPDIDSAAEKLLKPDEDTCCKDWNFHLRRNKIVLARGVYHKNVDGNCCPSRGGIVAELLPKDGHFELTKIGRLSDSQYQKWLWTP